MQRLRRLEATHLTGWEDAGKNAGDKGDHHDDKQFEVIDGAETE